MRKIRGGKKVLRVGTIGLTLFSILVIFACAPIGYDFIGTWKQQPGTLTYVNYDQHIKLTFPSDEWRVYTRPHKDTIKWKRPTDRDKSYMILFAGTHYLAHTAVYIEPMPLEYSLDLYGEVSKDYLEKYFKREKKDAEILESKKIQRRGKAIWTIIYKVERIVKDKELDAEIEFYDKRLLVIFKDKERFTNMIFSAEEHTFALKLDDFWAIVDSYEYLE